MIFLNAAGEDMKINCPLDYSLVSPSDPLHYGNLEVISGEK